jgi:DNA-binding MarR family transcriptional regulator
MNATVPVETTWAVKDTCLCLHAQRAARALARRFDEALKPVGLTNAQFSLVNALNGPEPASLAKLARILGADRTTLTAALKLLGRRGLTENSVDPNDRRAKRVRLTDAGHAKLAAALPLWRTTGSRPDLPTQTRRSCARACWLFPPDPTPTRRRNR